MIYIGISYLASIWLFLMSCKWERNYCGVDEDEERLEQFINMDMARKILAFIPGLNVWLTLTNFHSMWKEYRVRRKAFNLLKKKLPPHLYKVLMHELKMKRKSA